MLSKVRQHISRHITNLNGWTTDRKIIVLESDDWGSIRMPSKRVYDKCLEAGYQVDQIAYERFDSLASEDDLELLFDLLSRHKDKEGHSPVITANILVANPDFEKIKSSGFNEYFYEPISKTFNRYPNHSQCLSLWKQAMSEGMFYPQSHGREHLNISRFMNALQQEDPDVLFGFEHNMPGCMPRGDNKGGNNYVESLRYNSEQDKRDKLSIILEGLELFESLMGYRSESLIPPNYLWSPAYNVSTSAAGVQFYQGQRKMKEPLQDDTVKFHSHRLGEKNIYGQRYLVRNAFFEPALFTHAENPVERCLKDVSTAFRMNKPAIICSHRLNYVGFIDENNRDKNLKMLDSLLRQILEKWPDVEFLNSVELGSLIREEDE